MPGRSDPGACAPVPPSRFALPREDRGILAPRDRAELLRVVTALLSTPTAPYFEDGVLRVVRALCVEIPGVELVADRNQNLLAARGGRGGGLLAFSAHLDHPGFHALVRRDRAPAAVLLGGVPLANLPGARLRFSDPYDLRTIATARIASAAKDPGGAIVAELDDVRGTVRAGSFGVFDLSDGVVRGARLHARVCDDLLGVAATIVALAILAREGHARPVAGIFTRAEETGFVGCIGLLEAGLLERGACVIGLECSPRRATARVGHGPVVRVGDRLSTFDPELTRLLSDAAGALAARTPAFRSQRALMDGGSCESTAYNAWGIRAGGACLALGNYHNQGARGGIEPEYVDWHDLEGLVALLVESARRFGDGSAARPLRDRLLLGFRRDESLLDASARRILARPGRKAAAGRRTR